MSQWIRQNKWAAIVERDGYTCMYCGSTFEAEWFTLDHVIPREKGGSNKSSNLVCSCQSCNSSKGTKNALTWLREQYGQEKAKEIRKAIRRQTARKIIVRKGSYLALRVLWSETIERRFSCIAA